MTASDRDHGEKLTQVMSTVSHHVEEEEGELFPALRRSVSAELLAEAGNKMQRAKAVAPTRPHPAAPDTPPGNKILGPFAAVLDKMRDSAREFGSED